MKISVAICDDLEEERFGLARMVQHYGREHQLDLSLSTFASGDELLSQWTPGRWDIIFLDIYMPGLSGVDTAFRIRESDAACALVFATTSQDHGLVGFDLQISDYLVKPFRQEDVDGVFDWVLQEQEGNLRTIRIHADWEEVEVRLRDIAYIESQRHTALLHAGGQILSTRRGLDDLSEEIGGSPFFRCRRSYLVNLEYVSGIQKRDFLMRDGTLVPISLQNLSQARHLCLEWALEKNWGKT